MRQEHNIYDYSDYRIFLKNFYQSRKKQSVSWSYNVWATNIGLKNGTSILKVVNGQRNAGSEITDKLIQYFEFNKKESEYFKNLIKLDKVSKDPEYRLYILSELRRLSPKKNFKIFKGEEFEIISKWWNLPIRQLIKISKIKVDDYKRIQSLFLFKPKLGEIKKSLSNLFEMGLVKNKNGYLECSFESVDTSGDIASEAIKQYHESTLELAKNSLRKIQVNEREVSSITLCMDPQDIEEIKKDIYKFQLYMQEKYHPGNQAQVFQVQTQVFPVTETIYQEEKKELPQ